MKNISLKKHIERRFLLLSALKGISFGVLSWRLFDLQVIENKKYDKLSKDNQFNFSLVIPERGEIYDRKGRVLAANRDAFSLYIKSSENLSIKKILNKLSLITNINKEDINNLIEMNTLMFVALHELAHVMTKSIGHTDEFWNNFRFLLKHAIANGLYIKQDFKNKPVKYCGTMITDSP